MIIELLALQLRANPNIVGFTVLGEKIISSHYSDDAVIKITQNRCFKEVYKDLMLYEEGTGAKINYSKTNGLWLGRWKNRTDDPFCTFYSDANHKIKWTNKNVKYLGIFVGNDNPASHTFSDIIPKIKKRLNFWKPLSLPILSKSRVIEIFHASKLWYAASFYTIPENFLDDINKIFDDYIMFPKKKQEVSRTEMEKERLYGGIKLINTKLKSMTPKIQWLTSLITNPDLHIHLQVFKLLIGEQKGGLDPVDVIFANRSYMLNCLKLDNDFYKEAFYGMAKLNTWKHISDINSEHVFYNPIFTTIDDDDTNNIDDRTLRPFYGNPILASIRTYQDLHQAQTSLQPPRLKAATKRKLDSISHTRYSTPEHEIVGYDLKVQTFKTLTQKFIYTQLILEKSVDHNYQTKWLIDINDLPSISWSKVWNSLHNQFFTEKAKSTIWEQIHLNFYTTYNYMIWHNKLLPCPLCNRIPDDIYHILLDCRFVETMWLRVQHVLLQIIPIPLSKEEVVFGLQARTREEEKAAILRNWVSFNLRHLIMQEERKAWKYEKYTAEHGNNFVQKFNNLMQNELTEKHHSYKHRGLEHKFQSIISVNNVIQQGQDGEYRWTYV